MQTDINDDNVDEYLEEYQHGKKAKSIDFILDIMIEPLSDSYNKVMEELDELKQTEVNQQFTQEMKDKHNEYL